MSEFDFLLEEISNRTEQDKENLRNITLTGGIGNVVVGFAYLIGSELFEKSPRDIQEVNDTSANVLKVQKALVRLLRLLIKEDNKHGEGKQTSMQVQNFSMNYNLYL